jgi:hypothetical protein
MDFTWAVAILQRVAVECVEREICGSRLYKELECYVLKILVK